MRKDLLPTTIQGKIDHVEEECAEVILAIAKMRRFGQIATDPVTKKKYYNLCVVMNEIEDLKAACLALCSAFDK